MAVVTALEAAYGRHAYALDPTPERPVVRLSLRYFGPACGSEAVWIRDDGQDIHLDVIAECASAGVSHFCEDMSHNELCDVCKKRHAFRYDDFFGYVCTLCEITHPLRYKVRGVNPWG